jgi:hypothetical protein
VSSRALFEVSSVFDFRAAPPSLPVRYKAAQRGITGVASTTGILLPKPWFRVDHAARALELQE